MAMEEGLLKDESKGFPFWFPAYPFPAIVEIESFFIIFYYFLLFLESRAIKLIIIIKIGNERKERERKGRKKIQFFKHSKAEKSKI